jgi:hypothetical protein
MDDRQLEKMVVDGKNSGHCFSNRTCIMNSKRVKWMDGGDSDSLIRSRSFNIKDPVDLDPSYQLGGKYGDRRSLSSSFIVCLFFRFIGWVSDNQMDHFLTRQAEMIEKTGTSDIPPALLHQYLDYLQKNAPDIGKIYQVR